MDMSERLRLARERAGFDTAAAAAARFNWPETTYRHHENGTRNFPKSKAVTYGRAFRVSLIDGRKFVKIVRPEGRVLATLESWNAPPIRSVHVEWVAPILWVKRR